MKFLEYEYVVGVKRRHNSDDSLVEPKTYQEPMPALAHAEALAMQYRNGFVFVEVRCREVEGELVDSTEALAGTTA